MKWTPEDEAAYEYIKRQYERNPVWYFRMYVQIMELKIKYIYTESEIKQEEGTSPLNSIQEELGKLKRENYNFLVLSDIIAWARLNDLEVYEAEICFPEDKDNYINIYPLTYSIGSQVFIHKNGQTLEVRAVSG